MVVSGRCSRAVRVSGIKTASELIHGLGSAVLTLLPREVGVVEGRARTIRVGDRFGRESRRKRRESRHVVVEGWKLGV